MAKRRIEVEAGSGNVFADLGYADARERTLKVEQLRRDFEEDVKATGGKDEKDT
jgi:hypothetical protein